MKKLKSWTEKHKLSIPDMLHIRTTEISINRKSNTQTQHQNYKQIMNSIK